jgi:hypothetical protein
MFCLNQIVTELLPPVKAYSHRFDQTKKLILPIFDLLPAPLLLFGLTQRPEGITGAHRERRRRVSVELARATPRDSSIDRPRRSHLCAPVRDTGAVSACPLISGAVNKTEYFHIAV